MEIRLATLEDMPQIKQGLVKSWVEHAQNEPGLLAEERMRNANVDSYYKPCFDPETRDQHLVLVAEAEKQLGGFVRADLDHIHPFFTHPDIVFLDDIYVFPDFRQQGIAHELIRRVEGWARAKGVKRLQGRVYTYNKPMQKVLTSMAYYTPHAIWDKVLE